MRMRAPSPSRESSWSSGRLTRTLMARPVPGSRVASTSLIRPSAGCSTRSRMRPSIIATSGRAIGFRTGDDGLQPDRPDPRCQGQTRRQKGKPQMRAIAFAAPCQSSRRRGAKPQQDRRSPGERGLEGKPQPRFRWHTPPPAKAHGPIPQQPKTHQTCRLRWTSAVPFANACAASQHHRLRPPAGPEQLGCLP